MISLLSTRCDQRVVGGPGRQLLRKHRRGKPALLRRLPRREQRDEAAHAVDQLKVGDEVAELLDRIPRHQVLALDHDQHVELGGGKALGHLFVLAELLGVGAEQLAERIVDLDTLDAERRGDAKQGQDDGGQDRSAEGNEADPLNAVGQIVQLARRGSIGRHNWRESFVDTGVPSGMTCLEAI